MLPRGQWTDWLRVILKESGSEYRGLDHNVSWKIKEPRTLAGTTGAQPWLLLNILPSFVCKSARTILSAASAGTRWKNSIRSRQWVAPASGKDGIGEETLLTVVR